MNIPSFELTAVGKYVIRFYLSPSLKTGLPNHSGTLLNVRHTTIVLIASYVACLIGFSSDGHNCIFWKSRGKIEKKHPKKSFEIATIGDLALLLHSSLVMVYKDRPNYKVSALTVKRRVLTVMTFETEME